MLFDTDVIIWALRGSRKAVTMIDQAPNRLVSAVTWMELIKGVRDKGELRSVKGFLLDLGFEILPISEAVSHRATIYMEEFSLGAGMDLADALIAATATERALKLCTGNHKHYRAIPELVVVVFRPE